MFDWLRELAGWLQQFIVNVPIYYAAPAMVVIGALDSSLLSLPEINDYLVVARCFSDPKAVFYFPLFAAAGSVLGCLLLYTVMRRGGQAVMRRRFRAEHIERVERAYARYGFFALAIPALLPPPMPFKIFVATAGALEYPRWRFMLTIMIARSVRYFVEGALAVFYGRRVLLFLKDNGLMILSVAAALSLVALMCYMLVNRFKERREARRAPDAPAASAGENAAGVEKETEVSTSSTTLS
ncbi:MAG TPA: VTT domain-containing protein [Pyrinomonadaceae bacterium]|jgi:membrane protein YqaA with SNARE-associated domain|nr:VTT domain-containing protein [Pyrinomonadaceae bacterium]